MDWTDGWMDGWMDVDDVVRVWAFGVWAFGFGFGGVGCRFYVLVVGFGVFGFGFLVLGLCFSVLGFGCLVFGCGLMLKINQIHQIQFTHGPLYENMLIFKMKTQNVGFVKMLVS